MEESKVNNANSMVKTAHDIILYGSDGETMISDCESDGVGA